MPDDAQTRFEKHKVPSSYEWCPIDTQPATKQKKRTKDGKSIRMIGGALPGLGMNS